MDCLYLLDKNPRFHGHFLLLVYPRRECAIEPKAILPLCAGDAPSLNRIALGIDALDLLVLNNRPALPCVQVTAD